MRLNEAETLLYCVWNESWMYWLVEHWLEIIMLEIKLWFWCEKQGCGV